MEIIMLSQKFVSTIRLHNLRSYKIAQKAGIHPSTLSKLINGIEKIYPNDKRILRIGKVLGLKPVECFEGELLPEQAKVEANE